MTGEDALGENLPALTGPEGGSEPSAEPWRAPALDVRGPGARGRPQPGNAGRRDDGQLWIATGALYFSGRLGAWSVPLGWLDPPETGLDGVTLLAVRSADRVHAVSLRFARGAEDERTLAAAIRRTRTQPPDARELRALDDLLLLLGPELQRLDAEAAALERSPDAAAFTGYAASAMALAEHLGNIWLPYWGDPATRLRAATAGALIAVAEASAPSASPAAAARCEQAVRRWRNMVDDLRAWCGVPLDAETLPPPRLPRRVAAQPDGQEEMNEPPPIAAAVEPPPLPAMPSAAAQAPAPPPTLPEPPAAAPPMSPASQAAAPSPAAMPLPPLAAWPRTEAPPAVGVPPDDDVYVLPDSDAARGDTDQEAAAQEPPAAPAFAPPAPAFAIETGPGAPTNSGWPVGSVLARGPQPAGQPVLMDGIEGSGGMTRLLRREGPQGATARKVLTPAATAVPDAAETFLRLGQRFGAVQHHNLVRILGAGRDDDAGAPYSGGVPYINMEWVDGETLGARAERGPLTQELALRILEQLAEAIDTLHFAGLTHGDVRPQNVLIDAGGRAVLLEPSVASDHHLEKQRGTVFGEPAFLTPERLRGEPAVARSDVYGLGTLAFLLLSGRPPFVGTPAAVIGALLDQPAPSLTLAAPGVSPGTAEAVAQTLAKRPEDRPVWAVAFVAALRRAFLMAARQEPRDPPAPRLQPAAQERAPGLAAHLPPSAPPRMAPSPGRAAPSPLGRVAPRQEDSGADDTAGSTIVFRPRE